MSRNRHFPSLTLCCLMPENRTLSLAGRLKKIEKSFPIRCEHYEHFPYGRKFDENTIFLCDNDLSVSYASFTGCPVIALSHDGNHDQSLMGAGWLIESPDSITEFFLEEVYCHHYHLPLLITETGRCLIRELSMEDLPDLIRLQDENADRPEGRFFNTEPSDYARFLEDYIRCQYPLYGYGLYAVTAKEPLTSESGTEKKEARENQFLGLIGFSGRRMPSGSDNLSDTEATEVCYSFLTRYHGMQYAYESLSALLDFAGSYWDMKDFFTFIPPGNSASRALAARLSLTVLAPEEED